MEEWVVNVIKEVSLSALTVLVVGYLFYWYMKGEREDSKTAADNFANQLKQIAEQNKSQQDTFNLIVSKAFDTMNANTPIMTSAAQSVRNYAESLDRAITAMPDYAEAARQERRAMQDVVTKKLEETQTNLSVTVSKVIDELHVLATMIKDQSEVHENNAAQRSKLLIDKIESIAKTIALFAEENAKKNLDIPTAPIEVASNA